ncbi:MAG: acyl-CoA dehydrogenase [Deltaproteobacteria bacterium]|nr:MAG: acyl-CoA dehydrogenase [Deltaproteobacteria bacterium]
MPLAQSWFDLYPTPLADDALLVALDAEMQAQTDALVDAARAKAYPKAVLDALRARGLAQVFTGSDATPVSSARLCALNAISARHSGGLAISLGIFSLALLPVYIAGDDAQKAEVFAAVREGEAAGLLLTELDAGSDLLSVQTRATLGLLVDGAFVPTEDEPTHLRVVGEKHLINGGQVAEVLVTLARSGDPVDPDSPFGSTPPFTLMVIRRSEGGVEPLPAWDTLPAPGSDISGVKLAGALVPRHRVLGKEGGGFALVQQVLTMSRGGVASLAAGAAQRAWDLTWAHANDRVLYGEPIVGLGPIADHVLRTEMYALLANALAAKTGAMMNALGQAAGWYTAAAKLACCQLAEQAVDEGRRVLGARALVHELPYAQLVRDVLLYGVFDGTSHVMQNHLAGMVVRMKRGKGPTVERLREVYATPPQDICTAASRRRSPLLLPLDAHVRELATLPGADLAPLVSLVDALLDAIDAARAGDVWQADHGVRARFATHLASVEALLAVAELADPDRRAALGISHGGSEPTAVAYTLAAYGSEVAAELARTCALAGLEPPAEPGFAAVLAAVRRDRLAAR